MRTPWITPVRRGYEVTCCSCGLVHSIDFRIVKAGPQKLRNVIQFRVERRDTFEKIQEYKREYKREALKKKEGGPPRGPRNIRCRGTGKGDTR